jgi:hypothetical protein
VDASGNQLPSLLRRWFNSGGIMSYGASESSISMGESASSVSTEKCMNILSRLFGQNRPVDRLDEV